VVHDHSRKGHLHWRGTAIVYEPLQNRAFFTYALTMRHSPLIRIPPVSALRAFEASARLGSFSRAAEELHVTHGSICRHVAALEVHFGRRLFVRHARGVTPTAAARRFESIVRDALDRLAEGVSGARQGMEETSRRVAVSVLPSFAGRWLLPRLSAFKKEHPTIDVDLTAEQELVDFSHRRPKFDIAIRYGMGSWRGLHTMRFLTEDLTPLCAPAASANADFKDLLSRLPIVHDSNEQAWSHWLSRTGFELPQSAPAGFVFNDYNLVLEAAAQGLGIALGRSPLVAAEISAKRLVEVSSFKVPSLRAYYVVHAAREPLRDHAAAFCDWLRRVGEACNANVRPSSSDRSAPSTSTPRGPK
jgi:LysR family glycine cleavage system transcriptional activator